MAPGPRTDPSSSGEVPVTSKNINLTESASCSEIGIQLFSNGRRGENAFSTHGLRQDNYRPVDTYEGIHRYDPDFEWDPEEERKVVRKVRYRRTCRGRYTDEERSTSAFAHGSA